MKQTRIFMLMLFVAVGFFSSCEKEEPQVANVTFATIATGDIDGDVTGNGGSTSKNYTWENSLTKADYSMDITATKGGSFRLLVKDADGQDVLDKTIVAGAGEDSKSGVTSTGTPGPWTVTVTLDGFNGDGSFSLSKGD